MANTPENLVTARAPSTSASPSTATTPKNDPRIARFTASILVLCSIGLAQLICQALATGIILPVAQLLIAFLCGFTYEWSLLHGEGLTRTRRAYFDVANVLETYHTRARTMGHLFNPDPPTPMVSFSADGGQPGMTHEASTERTDFINARDAHYANMYQIAMKMNKELDFMEKADKEGGKDSTPSDGKDGEKKEPKTDKNESAQKSSSKKPKDTKNTLKL
ncbi:hypothetical protein OESDEN_16942 [Oesophagostomum dentatum]|uniref:Uncharacterized protein n=1 Tax=Oesophagostomum dentatum TaxID=61180 RepID=A0A0B1SHI5_OESDE|nr:hypothetical protein OESDEN_16942 [Oesophagostomum dentatum]